MANKSAAVATAGEGHGNTSPHISLSANMRTPLAMASKFRLPSTLPPSTSVAPTLLEECELAAVFAALALA